MKYTKLTQDEVQALVDALKKAPAEFVFDAISFLVSREFVEDKLPKKTETKTKE